MVTCARLLHLMESFATPWFLFAKPTNHYLVFYLLEILNNVIQYQFDGNTNLIYSIIRSKAVFYQIANLPEDSYQLVKSRAGSKAMEQARQEADTEDVHQVATEESGGGEDGPGVSVATNGNRVADIRPLGRIHTVQVEVEPNVGENEEVPEEGESPQSGDSGREDTGGETGRDGGETGSGRETGVEEGLREETSQEEPPSPPAPSSQSTIPSTTGARLPPSQPVPTQQLAAPPSENSGRLSPSSLPTVAEGLQEAGRKASATKKSKSKKPKGLSTKDLFPLHQDVGRSNKQLLEPSTPDFKPTTEWVRAWKHKLPLNTVLRVLQVLVPQVEKLCTENDVKSEHEVLEYLKNGTLVGLLPVPHPILIRKYQTSDSTELWFHTYIWGVIYVRNFDPPIWYDTTIKLFQVHKTDAPEATSK